MFPPDNIYSLLPNVYVFVYKFVNLPANILFAHQSDGMLSFSPKEFPNSRECFSVEFVRADWRIKSARRFLDGLTVNWRLGVYLAKLTKSNQTVPLALLNVNLIITLVYAAGAVKLSFACFHA
jgi:hypothetical protein